MDRTKAIELLKNAVPAKTMPDDEIGFFIEAISMAIAALEKEAEHQAKLAEIKSRFKEHYYNKGYKEGYEQGRADAEKEMHDNILRYRMPEPWEGE